MQSALIRDHRAFIWVTASPRRGERSIAVYILIATALTCWVCTLVAAPRRPLPGNEVEELVYARLLGRQQRLLLLTLVITGIALVGTLAAVPQHINPDLHALRDARGTCTYPASGGPI